MSPWTPELRRRVPVVLGAAMALGFAGGAWLAWRDSDAAWYYALGVVLAAVAAMQVVAPWTRMPPGSDAPHRPRGQYQEGRFASTEGRFASTYASRTEAEAAVAARKAPQAGRRRREARSARDDPSYSWL